MGSSMLPAGTADLGLTTHAAQIKPDCKRSQHQAEAVQTSQLLLPRYEDLRSRTLADPGLTFLQLSLNQAAREARPSQS